MFENWRTLSNARWSSRKNRNCVEQDFIFKQQPPAASSSKESLEEVERAHILRVLETCGGNQSRAAEVLDIDRVTLHHKLKRYGWSRATAGSRN